MNTNPNDITRSHGSHPGRFLNLASGDGILLLDVQAAAEVIAISGGMTLQEAEISGLSVTLESVKKPTAARELYTRLRKCHSWEMCPHGYSTTMSLSAASAQRIGPFLVRAPWQAADPNTLDIVIQPGLSFGLGTHATTRLPLRQLVEAVSPGARCADVGCGSGVLTIAMARLGAGEIVAVDVDATAVHEAADNVRRNGVEHVISGIRVGSADSLDGEFDVIAANMGGAPSIVTIAPGVCRRLKARGLFLASGIYGDTDDEAARVANGVSAALGPLGLTEEHRDTERQCVGIVYRRQG
jgi:ribosomal protein L11 methylase PrmA